MHNKHAFSPGVLYSGHVWNDVLFHNRKSYLVIYIYIYIYDQLWLPVATDYIYILSFQLLMKIAPNDCKYFWYTCNCHGSQYMFYYWDFFKQSMRLAMHSENTSSWGASGNTASPHWWLCSMDFEVHIFPPLRALSLILFTDLFFTSMSSMWQVRKMRLPLFF